MTEIEALTQGLLEGYAGKGKIVEVKRASFTGKASHIEKEGFEYHDEWFVPSHLGGGQELIKTGEEMFTRVYAGGTPNPKELAKLGITPKDVSNYLKKKIVELGDKTRLEIGCYPQPDGDWHYTYEILLQDSTIGVTVAAESITFKGTRVHLHPFILSPVA